MTIYFRFLCLFILSLPLCGLSLELEPNAGQAGPESRYLARMEAARVYVSDRGIEFDTRGGQPVKMRWTGGSTRAGKARWREDRPTGNRYRYCNQPIRELCSNGVEAYRRIQRLDLYPGIDWIIYGRERKLEYDLVIHPGADPEKIKFKLEGATALLDAAGRLNAGPIVQWRPEAYQLAGGERIPVEVDFQVTESGEVGFKLGAYRADLDLIIDPVIEALSFAGGEEDDITSGALRDSRGYRFGTTRSGDWRRTPGRKDQDIFVQFLRGQGTLTIFWGGEGEEAIGGFDHEQNNAILLICGWTSSRNAPLLSSFQRNHREYAGGETDGFVLEFRWGDLSFATYAGGPGEDKIHDIRHQITVSNPDTGLLFAGETNDGNWPAVKREQPVERMVESDAFVGVLSKDSIEFSMLGGTGADRAVRLRRLDAATWIVAGETTSADLWLESGRAMARKRDIWVGRVTVNPLQLQGTAAFGGRGDDVLGGMDVIPGEGIYLAGTTDSDDLPYALQRYGGGPTDGFLAHLDPDNAGVRSVSYIGGEGRDEIAGVEAHQGDLYLGGSTNSQDPRLPGLAPGQDAAGGMDGLFVYCDAFAAPMLGVRFGGEGDDVALSVSAGGFGKAVLSGWSTSREWLRSLDPYSSGGGQDGFAFNLQFSAVRVVAERSLQQLPGIGTLTLGKDLSVGIVVIGISEPGMDGVLLARSSDPTKLLLSEASEKPGAREILIQRIDGEYPPVIYLQALSGEGSAEVTFEGRAGSKFGSYPRRKIRVQFAPVEVYFDSLQAMRVQPGGKFNLNVITAPRLPNGKQGPAQGPRPGVSFGVSVQSSDPSVVPPPLAQEVTGSWAGIFGVSLRMLATGQAVLTPIAAGVATRAGQQRTIISADMPAPVFPGSEAWLAKHHMAPIRVEGGPGDRVTFISASPENVSVSTEEAGSGGEAVVTFEQPRQPRLVWLAGLQARGSVEVIMEGVLGGKPVNERIRIGLTDYKKRIAANLLPIAVGTRPAFQLELTPFIHEQDSTTAYLAGMKPRPEVVRWQLIRTEDETILAPAGSMGTPSVYFFNAVRAGRTRVYISQSHEALFDDLILEVEVVPARMDVRPAVIDIPAGASMWISAQTNLAVQFAGRVRARVAPSSPFTVQSGIRNGKDIELDLAASYMFQLIAEDAVAGQTGELLLSTPQIPEFAVPIRVLETVLAPLQREVRVAAVPGATNRTQFLQFEVMGHENGELFRNAPSSIGLQKAVSLRVHADPQGICDFGDTLEAGGGRTSAILNFICAQAGETTIRLEPAGVVSPAQRGFEVRIISEPAQPAALKLPAMLFAATGLQTQHSVDWADGTIRQITSGDPGKLRLSLDPKAAGGERVVLSPSSTRIIYLQGRSSEGVASLLVETTDGRRGEIPVHLFGSTLAVRPLRPSQGWEYRSTSEIEHSRAQSEVRLGVRPYMVDAASGKLITAPQLAISGGTDPFFASPSSSDGKVLQPDGPALMEEGGDSGQIKLKVVETGTAVVSVAQPPGFTAVPDSSLTVKVKEYELDFLAPPVLSANLQVEAAIRAQEGAGATVTVTSLDADRLLVSRDPGVAGGSTVSVAQGQKLYLQALENASAGSKARVRLEAPGYATTVREVQFTRAEIRRPSWQSGVLRMQPSQSATTAQILEYFPIDARTGEPLANYQWSLRPGVSPSIRISSLDSRILEVRTPEIALGTSMRADIRGIRPGRTGLKVEAPSGIESALDRVEVEVEPYQFGASFAEPLAVRLVSRLMIHNFGLEPASATVRGSGNSALRFGTTASGAGAPAAAEISIGVNPGEVKAVYVEPAGQSFQAAVRISAADYLDLDVYSSIGSPWMIFGVTGPLSLSASGGGIEVPVVLAANPYLPRKELPLGTTQGSVQAAVATSNSQVVQVPASVVIRSGESRVSLPIQIRGIGQAVVSLVAPAGFNEGQQKQDLLVTVK